MNNYEKGKYLEDKTADIGPGDGGIDISGEAASSEFIIQCKNWANKIGRNVVEELAGVLSRRENHGKIGIVVAPSGYLPGAKKAGRVHGIILTNVKDLCNDLFDFIAEKQKENDHFKLNKNVVAKL
ncbi:8181_t:CDS:2 [Funneliformis caledonium]|uniref:8181_t:CDS:1 n=1 Tax=Funneliformis caledonium TaxID=1117310 RepID=A0A9N9GPG8_9GLOM|nr:8181_t:CDS:2 [Funneliformis caledonium]